MILTAEVQKIKYILKLVSLQNYINICHIMYCYMLTITQTIGCHSVYICINVSIRNLPNIDFRSSLRIISLTCDNFISNQKIVLFIIQILESRFFSFQRSISLYTTCEKLVFLFSVVLFQFISLLFLEVLAVDCCTAQFRHSIPAPRSPWSKYKQKTTDECCHMEYMQMR